MVNIKKMKMQLLAAAASIMITAFALTSATYAWYVTNNTVEATTTSISATTNGFILQIATAAEGAQHGGEQKSLVAATKGHKISPSSTNDFKNWYVCQGWNGEGKVTSYTKPTIDDTLTGHYKVGDTDQYAYICSEYILYTITQSGLADVYLDNSDGDAITVGVTGDATSDTVPNSLRVGLATVDANGNETLRVVYAPAEVKGSGNDAQAISDKWTCIDGTKPVEVTYPYIYTNHYTDQNGGVWAATKSGDDKDYTAPTANGQKVASNVGYDGTKLRIYIWMEGTDADCVNNAATDDPAQYSVTVKLAGVAADGKSS